MSKRAEMWVEIVCDECAVTGPGQFVRGSRIPVREMTREAERLGWRKKTGGSFECPACTKGMLKRLEHIA